MRGKKLQIPAPLPEPNGSPGTYLTSWRRYGQGRQGSHHRGNRLHTVQGHLREDVGTVRSLLAWMGRPLCWLPEPYLHPNVCYHGGPEPAVSRDPRGLWTQVRGL